MRTPLFRAAAAGLALLSGLACRVDDPSAVVRETAQWAMDRMNAAPAR